MMRTTPCLPAGLFALALAVAPAARADVAHLPHAGAKKYTLRYQFHPGETLRWEVVHRKKTRTSASGATQTLETFSKSVKVWRVNNVRPDGSVTFEHLVENVDMRQKLSGHREVRYNSQTDRKPPAGFQHLAESIGVPLSVITIDTMGKIIKRERKKVKAAAKSEGPITIPLPDEPVPVGHTWSLPQEIHVTLNSGGIKKVKARQTFTLESVKTGVATIRVATRILTPIDDPAIESQLIQRETGGTVRFDVDAGRVLSQQTGVDKHVVGFRGKASSLHYATRFTEKLLPAPSKVARRAPGGGV